MYRGSINGLFLIIKHNRCTRILLFGLAIIIGFSDQLSLNTRRNASHEQSFNGVSCKKNIVINQKITIEDITQSTRVKYFDWIHGEFLIDVNSWISESFPEIPINTFNQSAFSKSIAISGP